MLRHVITGAVPFVLQSFIKAEKPSQLTSEVRACAMNAAAQLVCPLQYKVFISDSHIAYHRTAKRADVVFP